MSHSLTQTHAYADLLRIPSDLDRINHAVQPVLRPFGVDLARNPFATTLPLDELARSKPGSGSDAPISAIGDIVSGQH